MKRYEVTEEQLLHLQNSAQCWQAGIYGEDLERLEREKAKARTKEIPKGAVHLTKDQLHEALSGLLPYDVIRAVLDPIFDPQ